ncbi:MAG TPA: FAD-dependent oxidoreductase [Polyangiaceae bacterium]|jgi:flavin-dependent dehydrogenase
MFDIVIVGGGPGGSVCAAQLAERGHKLLVLERETFPRFHLGESLLPSSMPIFESIGVLPELSERFIHKFGARFHLDTGARQERYAFAQAFGVDESGRPAAGGSVPRFDHAFQVPRDEFDSVLLANAARKGAEVRHDWTVSRIAFEGTRAAGVVATDPGGKEHAIEARFVVDASGRDALLAGDRRDKSRIDRLDKSAFYMHYRNVERQEGERAGDIDIVVFDDGWFWMIPFKDGRTSVGAVVSNAWVKEHRGTADEMLERAIAGSPAAQKLLARAERMWPSARAAADYSYRVGRPYGDGWIALGDAGGFIDPLFSSGVHIAISGANRATPRIDEALRAGDVSEARFAPWAAEMKLGTDTFIDAVQAFYAGGLVRYLFAEKKHTFLRRSITSLLAGDVYSPDARWIVDVRSRLREMAAPAFDPMPIVGV